MARTYATPADLAAWTGAAAPGNAAGLLRHASTLVEGATVNAVYPTNTDGLPALAEQADAFRDATCAQAAFWAMNGLDPAAGALAEIGKGHATSKSIKGAAVSYSVTLVESNNQARQAALQLPCLEAWQILDNEGLIVGVVR